MKRPKRNGEKSIIIRNDGKAFVKMGDCVVETNTDVKLSANLIAVAYGLSTSKSETAQKGKTAHTKE
jgi:hypothetical protein